MVEGIINNTYIVSRDHWKVNGDHWVNLEADTYPQPKMVWDQSKLSEIGWSTMFRFMTLWLSETHFYASKSMEDGINMLYTTCLVFRNIVMVIDGHREPKSDFQQKFCGNETHTSKGVFFWQKRKKCLSKWPKHPVFEQISSSPFDW